MTKLTTIRPMVWRDLVNGWEVAERFEDCPGVTIGGKSFPIPHLFLPAPLRCARCGLKASDYQPKELL